MVTAIALHIMSLYHVAQNQSAELDLAYMDRLLLGQLSHAIATLRESTMATECHKMWFKSSGLYRNTIIRPHS